MIVFYVLVAIISGMGIGYGIGKSPNSLPPDFLLTKKQKEKRKKHER